VAADADVDPVRPPLKPVSGPSVRCRVLADDVVTAVAERGGGEAGAVGRRGLECRGRAGLADIEVRQQLAAQVPDEDVRGDVVLRGHGMTGRFYFARGQMRVSAETSCESVHERVLRNRYDVAVKRMMIRASSFLRLQGRFRGKRLAQLRGTFPRKRPTASRAGYGLLAYDRSATDGYAVLAPPI
jgi:hypothetical protein